MENKFKPGDMVIATVGLHKIKGHIHKVIFDCSPYYSYEVCTAINIHI